MMHKKTDDCSQNAKPWHKNGEKNNVRDRVDAIIPV